MAHDLHHLIRATFNTDMAESRDVAASFRRAVETLIRRRPLLDEAAARREVAALLGIDADALAASADAGRNAGG
jgi:hypothetical protein